jgi:hypothetical protein
MFPLLERATCLREAEGLERPDSQVQGGSRAHRGSVLSPVHSAAVAAVVPADSERTPLTRSN